MVMAKRRGTFRAIVLDHGLTESGEKKLATAGVHIGLTEEFANGEWVVIEGEGMEISGWFCLEKKDGSLNDVTIKNLKDALGWDGQSTAAFESGQFCGLRVQAVLDFEEYQGNTRLRWRYLNHYNREPGSNMQHSDANQVASIGDRLDSRLRALSGGTPVAAPPKPAAAKPMPPPAGKSAATKPAPAKPAKPAPPKAPEQPAGGQNADLPFDPALADELIARSERMANELQPGTSAHEWLRYWAGGADGKDEALKLTSAEMTAAMAKSGDDIAAEEANKK